MMFCRICALFIAVLRAVAHQGTAEMVVIDGLGDVVATVMLQTNMTSAQENVSAKTYKVTVVKDCRFDIDVSATFAEFVAMTLFVVIGCGSAMGSAKEPGWVLQVALSFGFAITALAYAIGHYSGAQINCAVTLGLFLIGNLSLSQAIANFIAQMVGSFTGALLLKGIFPRESDKTGRLGTNKVDEKYTWRNALLGEAAMTFLLMFVVLETAINPSSKSSRELACVSIGFAVFLAHSVLIPIDGCSINPTRSFGPALISSIFYKDREDTFEGHWVFWFGPLVGAAAAALVFSRVLFWSSDLREG